MAKKLNKRTVYAIIDGTGDVYLDSLAVYRRFAIRHHAWMYHEPDKDGELSEWCDSLKPGHRKSWARRKKLGDRCVRVNVYLAA